MFKVGDKVIILRQDVFVLRNRKVKKGVVQRIDGEYIYVRPSYLKWELELYANEIKISD